MSFPRFHGEALRLLLAAAGFALLRCASATPPAEAEPTSNEVPVSEAPHPEPASEVPAPASETPSSEGGASAGGGRLAFTNCDADHRPEMCTREYRPVCGEVDTGVRCIKAPCPSSQQRTFGNACSACADAKTIGYWPVSCEQMAKENAAAPPVAP